jgi:hypothetical protein
MRNQNNFNNLILFFLGPLIIGRIKKMKRAFFLALKGISAWGNALFPNAQKKIYPNSDKSDVGHV